MRRWQYAMIANPSHGIDAVIFSHAQRATIGSEFKEVLGSGLKEGQSSSQFLHLNLGHVSTVSVAGLLGEDGWELVSHAVLTGGHEYWTFKKELN